VTEEKTMTRRQMIEEARLASIEGRWEDALTINQQLIDRTPRDAAAFNRIGKAHIELGHLQQAIEAYTSSLKIDPPNMIARQNLQRLEQLRSHEVDVKPRNRQLAPRTSVFIQEVGKTWVDELVHPASAEVIAEVWSGEALELGAAGGRLIVKRSDGVRLGEIDQRTASRVIELMKGGNTYEVYALGSSSAGLRVILRETYRHPSQADRVSFPRQISQAGKYLRERDVIRQLDEADFYFSDEDDEEVESDETTAEADVDADDDTAEPQAEEFQPEEGGLEDEENPNVDI
jgi:tetratricopeptide (TPR) repeat protein